MGRCSGLPHRRFVLRNSDSQRRAYNRRLHRGHAGCRLAIINAGPRIRPSVSVGHFCAAKTGKIPHGGFQRYPSLRRLDRGPSRGAVRPGRSRSGTSSTPATEHRDHPRRRPRLRRHGLVRQRDQHAEPRLLIPRGRALLQFLHPCDVLAHAISPADRRRHAPQRPGQHGRVDGAEPGRRAGLRGLPQQQRGDAAAAAEGRRLPHLHGRQVAPRQAARPDSGGTRLRARLHAARRRRQLLGHDELHRRGPEVRFHGGRALPHAACRRITTRPRPTQTS